MCSQDSQYKYVVIGSSAYTLYIDHQPNNNFNPDDIDISTSNLITTQKVLSNLKNTTLTILPESNMATNRFLLQFSDGRCVKIDSTHQEDFGYTTSKSVIKDGVRVNSNLC